MKRLLLGAISAFFLFTLLPNGAEARKQRPCKKWKRFSNNVCVKWRKGYRSRCAMWKMRYRRSCVRYGKKWACLKRKRRCVRRRGRRCLRWSVGRCLRYAKYRRCTKWRYKRVRRCVRWRGTAYRGYCRKWVRRARWFCVRR